MPSLVVTIFAGEVEAVQVVLWFAGPTGVLLVPLNSTIRLASAEQARAGRRAQERPPIAGQWRSGYGQHPEIEITHMEPFVCPVGFDARYVSLLPPGECGGR